MATPTKVAPTNQIPTEGIAQSIESQITLYTYQRRPFERRWYDNNFFDDGFHFRYMSRTTGKIVDQSEIARQVAPSRAIPKASRQIRGIANLLLALEPHPTIYPEKISASNFQVQDPATGFWITTPAFEQAKQDAKRIAQREGHFIEKQWDILRIKEHLAMMVLLAAKQGVSFLQLWPDYMSEKMCVDVFDAFDIFLQGSLTDIYKSPSIIKAIPTSIDQIKANELFDPVERALINPDNKYASSEIKQAYMQFRYGNKYGSDQNPTVLLKETFSKEYLNDDNYARIKKMAEDKGVMEGKKTGDLMMRHTFSTSNGALLDEYVDLPEYPYVDFRFEPGPIYQVPLIERFIPQNKSLDVAMSRIEAYLNTMVIGVYQQRKGENFSISNVPGGQILKYETTPLTQMQPTSIPPFVFEFISKLEDNINEQGAATASVGNLPDGVKSGKAIESIKATEYANLKLPTEMFKKTVVNITERILDTASRYFIEPQTVYRLEKGEPDYFDIIGEAGAKAREKAKLPLPQDTVVIKNNYHVTVEIESGLGYTVQGKKDTMQEIVQYVVGLAQQGLIPPEAVKVMTTRFLEIFQFGATQEFMEAMDQQPAGQMTEDQIAQMKIAVAEVLKDTGVVGPQAQENLIDTTKVGVAHAINDIQQAQQQTAPQGGPSAQPIQ